MELNRRFACQPEDQQLVGHMVASWLSGQVSGYGDCTVEFGLRQFESLPVGNAIAGAISACTPIPNRLVCLDG